MYILWTNNPTNPKLNGTKQHVPRSVAEVAIFNQQATLAPRPNYGTKEWAEERKALSAQAQGPFSGDTVTGVTGTEWGVLERHLSRFGVPVCVKKQGAETIYYSAPPDDAPAQIKSRFDALNQPVLNPDIEAERRLQDGYRRDEQQKQENAAARAIVLAGHYQK